MLSFFPLFTLHSWMLSRWQNGVEQCVKYLFKKKFYSFSNNELKLLYWEKHIIICSCVLELNVTSWIGLLVCLQASFFLDAVVIALINSVFFCCFVFFLFYFTNCESNSCVMQVHPWLAAFSKCVWVCVCCGRAVCWLYPVWSSRSSG